MSHMEWKIIETAPDDISYESDRRVDLWVMSVRSGKEFRVPNCFMRSDVWYSKYYNFPLRVSGLVPLFWIDPPSPPKS